MEQRGLRGRTEKPVLKKRAHVLCGFQPVHFKALYKRVCSLRFQSALLVDPVNDIPIWGIATDGLAE
jgi:hypothetical protein